MLGRELAEGGDDVLFDRLGLSVGLSRVVGNERRREIGVVDRVVDGYRDLECRAVVYNRPSNTCPHRL